MDYDPGVRVRFMPDIDVLGPPFLNIKIRIGVASSLSIDAVYSPPSAPDVDALNHANRSIFDYL